MQPFGYFWGGKDSALSRICFCLEVPDPRGREQGHEVACPLQGAGGAHLCEDKGINLGVQEAWDPEGSTGGGWGPVSFLVCLMGDAS